VTPLADAHMDSVPIVAITGQVNSAAIGTDAFQEADIRGITMPITKHNYLVTNADEIPRIIAEAFHIAATGRPGPVLVDISKDALQARTTFVVAAAHRPARLPSGHPPPRQADPRGRPPASTAAERPVLYVGGGVIKRRGQRGTAPLRRAEQDPRGDHPDGAWGPARQPPAPPRDAGDARHGRRGHRPPEVGPHHQPSAPGSTTASPASCRPSRPFAKVIHADIDPAEIGKNRRADVPIVGDCKAVITDLTEAVDSDIDAGRGGDYSEWRERVAGWKESFPVGYTEPEEASLAPQYVIERLSAIVGPEAVYVAGVGQHQMWAAQFVQYERPNAWLNSGGLGTMGYAVPAAMGAQVGEPDRTVWAIDGDGCFQMTNQELATCVINNIPIKVAVINNSSLGMVRQWQTLFYNERYSNTDLHTSVGSRVPDFVKLADAYGCAGFRCERPEDVDDTIRAAMAVNDRPVIVDFVVHRDAMVWPMVAAGVSNDLIQVARDTAPQWDREESEALEQDLDADHDGVPSGSPRN
jgi:acetolactate synthase-1/2/3 large subunit